MFKYRMSVIVPVYNCEDYLASCLDSLLRQTIGKDELEVLLIDDGSEDGSLGICRKYAEKHDIFKVFSLENGGVSALSETTDGGSVTLGKFSYSGGSSGSSGGSGVNSLCGQALALLEPTGLLYRGVRI